jgi:hypothetical protein
MAVATPIDRCADTIAGLLSRSGFRSAGLFPVAQKTRDEQKLWLILFQIKAIRTRINSLAAQFFAFSTLTIVMLSAVLVLAAALVLKPLGFLIAAIIVAITALLSIVRVTQRALRVCASPIKAAALADERAGLKGRLMTVLLMPGSGRKSGLWPYLVEDAYSRRGEFEPSKVEPRWFSRSILAFIGACVAAYLMVNATRLRIGSEQLAMSGLPNQVTADVSNLDIRPADPALEPNAEIYADEATLKKLADKLASAQAGANDTGGLSRWMNKARDLAGELQSEITGKPEHSPPVQLRLTDKDLAASEQARPSRSPNSHGGNEGASNFAAGRSGGDSESPQSRGSSAGQLAQNGVGLPGQLGNEASQANPNDLGSPVYGGTGAGGGASHGSGSDPEHLFGAPSSQPLGSDSFKITIDAQPSDESSTAGAPAYVPPKIKAPLNERQHDDEPIARASVPAADQMTIKRVFER